MSELPSSKELVEAATFAAAVLAELYAKYSTKIGPFASQAQKANGMLRAALKSASTTHEPLADREEIAQDLRAIEAFVERAQSMRHSLLIAAAMADRASQPPPAARPSHEQLAAIADLRQAMQNATGPGNWELYTSNSHKRIGLKGSYKEIIYADRAVDGHAELADFDNLTYAVAAANAAPVLLADLDRLSQDIARDAGTRAAILAENAYYKRRAAELEHSFKNFHRLLCERFSCVHDAKDWQRDQLSLIEWIAGRTAPPRPDAEALEAAPVLKDKRALVLYFPTDADRDEFVSLIHAAKPGMRTVKL